MSDRPTFASVVKSEHYEGNDSETSEDVGEPDRLKHFTFGKNNIPVSSPLCVQKSSKRVPSSKVAPSNDLKSFWKIQNDSSMMATNKDQNLEKERNPESLVYESNDISHEATRTSTPTHKHDLTCDIIDTTNDDEDVIFMTVKAAPKDKAHTPKRVKENSVKPEHFFLTPEAIVHDEDALASPSAERHMEEGTISRTSQVVLQSRIMHCSSTFYRTFDSQH